MAETKKRKKQIKPVSVIALILCSCVVLYFIYSFVKVQKEINAKKSELTIAESVLESRNAENAALESAVSEGNEAAIVEEQARDKGYVMPDERVYVDNWS